MLLIASDLAELEAGLSHTAHPGTLRHTTMHEKVDIARIGSWHDVASAVRVSTTSCKHSHMQQNLLL
eukprot:2719387-Amphidinium_carterae.2